ncbi:hypothetical protein KW816_23840, partial [Serratia ureilytica]
TLSLRRCPAYSPPAIFPFLPSPPSFALPPLFLIPHPAYDPFFLSVRLLPWNSQDKFNVTVYRNLPTTRDSIMTS